MRVLCFSPRFLLYFPLLTGYCPDNFRTRSESPGPDRQGLSPAPTIPPRRSPRLPPLSLHDQQEATVSQEPLISLDVPSSPSVPPRKLTSASSSIWIQTLNGSRALRYGRTGARRRDRGSESRRTTQLWRMCLQTKLKDVGCGGTLTISFRGNRMICIH